MTPGHFAGHARCAKFGAMPAWLLRLIDATELARLPAPTAGRVRRIGGRLKANLVAYKSEARSSAPERMLCRTMAVASLSEFQIRALQRLEKTMSPRVTLVAYASPWRRRAKRGGA